MQRTLILHHPRHLLLMLLAMTLALTPALASRSISANGAPTIAAPATTEVITTEFTPLFSAGPLSGFSGNLRVVVTATNGTLLLTETTDLQPITGFPSANWTSTNATEIGFSANDAAANAALASLHFKGTAGGAATLNISTGDAEGIFNPANNHYYQYVEDPVTWVQARCLAKYTDAPYSAASAHPDQCGTQANAADRTPRTLFGLEGYLATVTNADENAFITSRVGTASAWLGGSDQVTTSAGNPPQEGVWRWVDGPEAGVQFSDQGVLTAPCSVSRTGLGVNGSYVNWNTNEPNNCNNNEGALQILSGGDGKWNDLPINSSTMGYVIEYGGNDQTPVGQTTETFTLNVSTGPGAPVGLVATSGDQTIHATWSAGTGTTDTYVLDYRQVGDESWTTLAGLTATTAALTGLATCTSYEIRVRGANNAGEGAPATVFATSFGNGTFATPFAANAFRFGGVATVSAGSTVTLTPDAGGQFGAVWNGARVDLSRTFCVDADLYLGDNDAGADGMAFVLQPNSTAAGSSGGGLGYAGISPSLAVEFDTFQNATDPVEDHVGLMRDGATTHPTGEWGPPRVEVGNIEDGTWRRAHFLWDAPNRRFTVRYDLNADGTFQPNEILFDSVLLDLPTHFSDRGGFVYWGFTAATGGAHNLQQVRNISYSPAGRANTAPTITGFTSPIEVKNPVGTQTIDLTLNDDSTFQDQWQVSVSADNPAAFTTAPSITVLSDTTARITFTPITTDDITSVLTVSAVDADGASTTTTLTLNIVNRVAQTPLIFTADTLSLSVGQSTEVTVSGGSGTGDVTVSAGPSTACTVDGFTVTVTQSAGTCVLTATKAADEDYLAASATLTITVVQPAGVAPIDLTPPTTPSPTLPSAPPGGISTTPPGTPPQSLTELDAPRIATPPGQSVTIIEGERTSAEVRQVNPEVGSVPPAERTPAQIEQLRNEAEVLLQQYLRVLPDPTESPVRIAATPTGAEVIGLLTDPATGTPLAVPVEHVTLVLSGNTAILLAAADPAGNVIPPEGDGYLRLSGQDQVGASAAGFSPDTEGEIVIFSSPRLLATFLTDISGTFSGQFDVPADLAPGVHTVAFVTPQLITTLGLLIEAPSTQREVLELPQAGTGDLLVAWAILAGALGGLALLIGRRRLRW